jgi:hypothetical protein
MVAAVFFIVMIIGVIALKVALFYYDGKGLPKMPWVFSDGGRAEAGFRGHGKSDCVVRSIAIVTGRPYREVYDTVNEFCAKERPRRGKSRSSANSGVYMPTIKKIMSHYGAEWVPTIQIGQVDRIHLAEGELPSGRLIVRVSSHVVAVVDGVIFDNHDPQRHGDRMVYGYWKF